MTSQKKSFETFTSTFASFQLRERSEDDPQDIELPPSVGCTSSDIERYSAIHETLHLPYGAEYDEIVIRS